MDDKIISPLMKLNNGLSQVSVPVPLLFSPYLADNPFPNHKKEEIVNIVEIVKNDLVTIGRYFRDWRLQPNAHKVPKCLRLQRQNWAWCTQSRSIVLRWDSTALTPTALMSNSTKPSFLYQAQSRPCLPTGYSIEPISERRREDWETNVTTNVTPSNLGSTRQNKDKLRQVFRLTF